LQDGTADKAGIFEAIDALSVGDIDANHILVSKSQVEQS